ncbi:MAG TPA: MtnX-like HAD-IB family phosphatase [Xanthobacteraceae bacterium]|nr:MtnX-like HAD-IB family phosphatase [Xanthobacteraceae bacterium]
MCAAAGRRVDPLDKFRQFSQKSHRTPHFGARFRRFVGSLGATFKMPSRVRVFVDFDGTISLEDTTDVVLERFADPSWQKVEADWLAGRIGSRECLRKQIDLVRATPEELDSVCESVPLDPHFPELVALCRRHRIPLAVVSDGLERLVKKMLARIGVDVPILANRLAYLGDRRWRLDFPHSADDCRAGAGHCKCLALTNEPKSMRIMIGDGRSDFCAAETADLVIAKGALVEHCQANGLPYIVFGNFAGATTVLADWIGAIERQSPIPHLAPGPIDATPAA